MYDKQCAINFRNCTFLQELCLKGRKQIQSRRAVFLRTNAHVPRQRKILRGPPQKTKPAPDRLRQKTGHRLLESGYRKIVGRFSSAMGPMARTLNHQPCSQEAARAIPAGPRISRPEQIAHRLLQKPVPPYHSQGRTQGWAPTVGS